MLLYSLFHREFLISFFISLYSLKRLFAETNSYWLIYESIKALEIRTSIVFNHVSSSFFRDDFYFLIPAVIEQIFIPTAELIITIRLVTNEANAAIETQPVTLESKINKSSI